MLTQKEKESGRSKAKMEDFLDHDVEDSEEFGAHRVKLGVVYQVLLLLLIVVFFCTLPLRRKKVISVVNINGDAHLLAMHDRLFFDIPTTEKSSHSLSFLHSSLRADENESFLFYKLKNLRTVNNIHFFLASISFPLLLSSSSTGTPTYGLSVEGEEQVLDALRSALLYGTPWLILTGRTPADSHANLAFLLNSPDVPHRLFSEEVLQRLTEYIDPHLHYQLDTEKIVKLARDLHDYFQTFSTTLGSWMEKKRRAKGWFVPYAVADQLGQKNVWEARVTVWERLLDSLSSSSSNSASKSHWKWGGKEGDEAKLFSSSSSTHSYGDGDTIEFDDNVLHTSHPLHEFAELEQVPRVAAISEQLTLLLPGIVSLTHPDIYYRQDLMAETLTTLMTTRILAQVGREESVMLQASGLSLNANGASQSQQREASKRHLLSQDTADITKNFPLRIMNSKYWSIYSFGVILRFPSNKGFAKKASSSDFLAYIDKFFLSAWKLSLSNSILLQITSIPAFYSNTTSATLISNRASEVTKLTKKLLFVSTNPKSIKWEWFRISVTFPFRVLRQLKREVVYHFYMVQDSLVLFPRESSFMVRLSHYCLYLFHRVESTSFSHFFFFQLLNWVYKYDQGNSRILSLCKILFNYSFRESIS